MAISRVLKIGFVAPYDSSQIRHWSGTPYYMSKSLENQSMKVHYVGPLKVKTALYYKLINRFYKHIIGKSYFRDRAPAVLKNYALQISEQLSHLDVDIVFSPGTVAIAYLESSKPIVFWTDATFGGMIDLYPEFTNLCKQTIKDGNRMEMAALHRAKLAIYSSEWAAQTAKKIYQAEDSKVKVVPFGANIECNRTIGDIREIINNKNYDKCKLLFIGADWDRKGGNIALKIAKKLNTQGVRTELTVVGCKPDISPEFSSFVKVLGFISKSSIEGRRQIDQLLAQAHFLIMPTKAECFGIVFCEANSFGVPCISIDSGGVSSVVRSGVNGQLFRLEADIEEYCTYISDIFSKLSEYHDLCLSSFNEYHSRLNWVASGAKVKEYINKLL